MGEKNKYPETFESSDYRFGKLFKEFLFFEFLRSSLKDGKPSDFILKTSELLQQSYKKDKSIFGDKDILKTLDELIKDKAGELLEVMKILFPESIKEVDAKEETKEELKAKINELEKRITKLEKKK